MEKTVCIPGAFSLITVFWVHDDFEQGSAYITGLPRVRLHLKTRLINVHYIGLRTVCRPLLEARQRCPGGAFLAPNELHEVRLSLLGDLNIWNRSCGVVNEEEI